MIFSLKHLREVAGRLRLDTVAVIVGLERVERGVRGHEGTHVAEHIGILYRDLAVGSCDTSIRLLAVIAAAMSAPAMVATSGSPHRRGGLGAGVGVELGLLGIDPAARAHCGACPISGFFSTLRFATFHLPSLDLVEVHPHRRGDEAQVGRVGAR